jgi:hypothetical protein
MDTTNNSEIPINGLTYKWIDIQVTTADQLYSVTYELDKTIGFVTGLKVSSNREPLLYSRGSLKVEINRQEVIPEGYESKNLYNTANVSVNDRYLRRGGKITAGNGQVKFEYKDTSDSLAPFEPYRVRLDLDCEMKDYRL